MITNKLYDFDEAFFDVIDNEPKAYWLGFIAADGYTDGNTGMEMSLAEKDRPHLESFRSALRATHPIQDKLVRLKGKTYGAVRINLRAIRFVTDLRKHGIEARKSLTFSGPIGVPDALTRHFVRGYFDGNGGFSYSAAARHRFQFYFTSTLTYIRQIETLLQQECEIKPLRLMDHHNTITFSIFQTGPKALRIADYLYDNATVYLARKREKAELYRNRAHAA